MTPAFRAGVMAKIAESNLDKHLRRGDGVTGADRGELRRHMGKSHLGCSMGRDKDGFYVYTHRARSKSYPRPGAIPKDRVRFVESTG